MAAAQPGRHLCLADQYAFTSGGCATFARAAQPMLGGRIALLLAKDRRQYAEHDHPRDVPLYLHVFLLAEDGHAVDAEGRRPVREMARSFGVREGYAYEVVTDPSKLAEEYPRIDGDAIRAAGSLIREHGWEGGVPDADDRLSRNWNQAAREDAARRGHAVVASEREARLYNLTPFIKEPSWGSYHRLEVRPLDGDRFAVVAIPVDPDEEELAVTAAATEEDAVEAAWELSGESYLDFDGPDPAPACA